jgi:hypothetical protein
VELEASADLLVQRVARAICANTNIAKPGDFETIFDDPDDLTWDSAESPPRPIPRWRLYERRARAALEVFHVGELADALHAIRAQVKRGQQAIPIVVERAFHDIDEFARAALEKLEK